MPLFSCLVVQASPPAFSGDVPIATGHLRVATEIWMIAADGNACRTHFRSPPRLAPDHAPCRHHRPLLRTRLLVQSCPGCVEAGAEIPIHLRSGSSGDQPRPGREWRGQPPVGGGQGNWFNPSTGESLYNDMQSTDHGPHWDYRQQGASGKWRWYPDGRMEFQK